MALICLPSLSGADRMHQSGHEAIGQSGFGQNGFRSKQAEYVSQRGVQGNVNYCQTERR